MWGLSPKLMLQWGVAAIVGIVLVWAGYTVLNWKHDAEKVPGLKQEIANHEATIKQIRHEVAIANAASEGYQSELARLSAVRDSAGPAPVVRVCKSAPQATVQVPGAQSGSDEGASTGGGVPQEAGPDIGPALYGIADQCDELSAQIRGLQKFIRDNAGE